jgi:hypothetical protein
MTFVLFTVLNWKADHFESGLPPLMKCYEELSEIAY